MKIFAVIFEFIGNILGLIFNGGTQKTGASLQKEDELQKPNAITQSRIKMANTNLEPAGSGKLVEWKISEIVKPTEPTQAPFTGQESDTFTSSADLSQTVVDRWQYNFETILGPANPVFVNAKWNPDYLERGIRLKYNDYGVLIKVDAAGNPTRDEVIRTKKQAEIIEETNYRTVGDTKSRIDASQDLRKASPITAINTKPVVSHAIKLPNNFDGLFWEAPKDNLTGPIEFVGIRYRMRVPFNDMGSNADINAGGWVNERVYDYSILGVEGVNGPEAIAKFAVEDTETKSKSVNLFALILAGGNAVADSYHPAPIQVIVQQKDNDGVLLVQVGVGSNVFQSYAGEIVEGSFKGQSFRVTLDPRHAGDPFTHYVSVDTNAEFVFTRKIYSKDKIEKRVNNEWKDCTAEYLMKSVRTKDDIRFTRIDESLKGVIKPQSKIYAAPESL